MAEIDYKVLAAKMREQTPPPSNSDLVEDAIARKAIYALIHAMEAMDG